MMRCPLWLLEPRSYSADLRAIRHGGDNSPTLSRLLCTAHRDAPLHNSSTALLRSRAVLTGSVSAIAS